MHIFKQKQLHSHFQKQNNTDAHFEYNESMVNLYQIADK